MSVDLMSRDAWLQYTELARRLDAVRAEELARTAGMRQGVAEMTSHADELEARLRGQAGMLMNLATILRLRRPKLDPIPLDGFVDPPTALAHVAGTIDRGDTESKQAAERGYYPLLFPKMPGIARNLVVYGSAALLVLIFQGLAFRAGGTGTSPLLVLFLIPLIGFVPAYLLLAIGARTRVAQAAAPSRSTRLGFVMCFAIGPLAAAVFVATSYQSRR